MTAEYLPKNYIIDPEIFSKWAGCKVSAKNFKDWVDEVCDYLSELYGYYINSTDSIGYLEGAIIIKNIDWSTEKYDL